MISRSVAAEVEIGIGKFHRAVARVMRKALGEHGRLFEDLLDHEVLVPGLVHLRGLRGDLDRVAVHLPPVGIADFHAAAGHESIIALRRDR